MPHIVTELRKTRKPMDSAGICATLPVVKEELAMLEQVNLKQKLAKEDYQAVMPALKARLAALRRKSPGHSDF